MRGFALSLLFTILSVLIFSSIALAAEFNVTFSTPSLNSSTPNQLFNLTIGNNATAGKNITRVSIVYFSFDGISHTESSAFSSMTTAFVNTSNYPMTLLSWANTSAIGIIQNNLNGNFSIRLSMPLRSDRFMITVNTEYTNGTNESVFVFINVVQSAINANVVLRGPANNSVYGFNDVNLSFNVTGDASYYACLAFTNQTTPFGQEFIPALAPPNFNVSNATNTNVTVFMPFGVWIWNVKCTPKTQYVATRTPTGYNVTTSGLPSSLNSLKVGDLVTFINNMGQSIRITFTPPMSPPFSVDLANGANTTIDTSPDFSNPLSMKPPLMGPFSDNVSDQFSFGAMGGFGSSGDPRFAPGVFGTANFSLNVTGPARPFFDPGQFFNSSGGGFSFSDGPCAPGAPEPKPQFCFPNASGGVSFNANDAFFFDKNPSFFMHGFTDCSDPANAAKPDCKLILNPFAEITGDSADPNLLFSRVGAFGDRVFVDIGTDEMSNMTIDFYGVDSYCGSKIITIIDEGLRNPTTGALIQNSRFKPFHHFEIGSNIASNVSVSTNTTYYYKTNTCDKAGNCATSSCKNITSGVTSFANAPVALNFTIPTGFSFSFNFPNGSVMPLGSQILANNLTNVTMKLQPTGASWGIDLPASAIATNSSFDFSKAFVTTSNGGKTYVGMNKTVWDSLAQRLGITEINITVLGTSDSLYKCDDNGANCVQVTSLAVKRSTNTSAGTSVWTVPVTLGFSTYVDVPGSSGTSGTTSTSSGGGASSSTTTTKVTKTYTSIIPEAPKTIFSSDLEAAGLKLTQVDIYVNERVTTVTITIEKLSAKPSSIPSEASATVYQYISFDKTNLDDSNVKKVVVNFKVEKKWLTDNKLSKTSISLYRYTDSWNKLATKIISEDNSSVGYQSETPGFSVFAIGSETAAPSVQTTTTTTTTETTTPATETTTTTEAQVQPPLSYSMILLIVVLIAIILFAVFRMGAIKK